jgi:hypothetical protein
MDKCGFYTASSRKFFSQSISQGSNSFPLRVFQDSCGLKANKIITVTPLAKAEGLKRIEVRNFGSLPLMAEGFSPSGS